MGTQSRRRRLEVEDIGDVTVVNFTDRNIVDEKNIEVIGDQLFSLVDNLGRKKILLSFSNVDYFSSACLGKLMTLGKKVTAAKGRLIMCGMNRPTYEVFEITKLNKLFRIEKEEQTALAVFVP